MAFGTYTVDFHQQFNDGMKLLLGHVTIDNGDVAFTTDLSTYFAKEIKQAFVWTTGAAFKLLGAIDITTTVTTLAATLTDMGAAGAAYYMVIGY